MKYTKDDCRAKGKPSTVLSVGPVYLEAGWKGPMIYHANQGPNRKARRSIDAMFRHEYGKVAFARMVKERKVNLKKAVKV